MKIPNKNRNISLALALLGALLLGGFEMRAQAFEKREALKFEEKFAGFRDPYISHKNEIKARGVIVIDETSGSVLHERRGDREFGIASIAKLMTAIVAKSALPAEGIENVTIDLASITLDGDQGFRDGEAWKLDELLAIMLTASSNDAAHSVGREIKNVFASREIAEGDSAGVANFEIGKSFTELGRNFGLLNTTFWNETGLDREEGDIYIGPGALSTPRDVAILLMLADKSMPEIMKKTTLPAENFTSLDGTIHSVKNTNILTERIPVLSGKTGWTQMSGGSLALRSLAADRPITIVVLGSGREERFTDALILHQSTEELFKELEARGLTLEDLRTRGMIE